MSPSLVRVSFGFEEVRFLGHVVLWEGISVDSAKVDAVLNWSRPSNASEIRSFIGLARYYCQFVDGFSKIVAPLTYLTRREAKFK